MNAWAGDEGVGKRNKTVLLVDDDENDVFLMAEAFKAARVDAKLCVAGDGEEAIAYLSKGRKLAGGLHSQPSLVLLDLKLPKVMGIEVLKGARRQPEICGLPIIVFSSSGIESDVEEAYRHGATSYVVKPHSHEQRISFAKAIKDYWFGWHRGVERMESVGYPLTAAA